MAKTSPSLLLDMERPFPALKAPRWRTWARRSVALTVE